MNKNQNNKAFSLVELSIVLIIIGLLVAAVTTGQKLIEGAKLSRIINEVEQLNTAVKTFEVTYDAIPGDFDIAESFWGAAATNNGNGNGLIESAASPDVDTEKLIAIHHMVLAEIINGTGVVFGTGTTEDADTLAGFAYKFSASSAIKGQLVNSKDTNETGFAAVTKGNVLQIGAATSAANDSPINAALTPLQAHQIDTKLDDADPDAGVVTVRVSGDVTLALCTNAAATPDGYLLSSSNVACNLTFELDS